MVQKIFLIICLNTICLIGFSQYSPNKKEIKGNNIQSFTVWDYKFSYDKTGGQPTETKYKSAYYKYDNNGEIAEEIEYNKDGTIKTKKSFKYDGNGNKTEEISYNSDGSIKSKETYKYNAEGLRTEKKVFTPDDKIESGKKYEYTYH